MGMVWGMKRISDIEDSERPEKVPEGSEHFDIGLNKWVESYMVGWDLKLALEDLEYHRDPTGATLLRIP